MNPAHLTLRQLQIVHAVADAGSIAAAARRLHLTGPALTLQIQQVERLAGMPLFDRVGRRLQLTLVGERVRDAAADVQRRLASLAKDLDAVEHRHDGTLHLGVLATGTHILPPLLADFRARAPNIGVQVQVDTREALLEGVRRGDTDLVLTGRVPERTLHESEFAREVFANNPHVFIGWPGHPLAAADSVPMVELRHEVFIQRESGAGTRAMLDEFFTVNRMRPRERITATGNEMVKHAVMSRLGISLVSVHTLGLELRAGALVRLRVESTPIIRRWYVIHHASRWLPPAASAFRDYLLSDGAAKVRRETDQLLLDTA